MANDLSQEQVSQQLISDLALLSSIPSDVVSSLGDRIENSTGFLRISNVVSKFVDDADEVEAIERLVAGISPKSVAPVLRMVEQWRTSDGFVQNTISKDQLKAIQQNLPLLIRNSPAVVRSRKAAALLTATGNELLGVAFVCDARPVFNEKRDDVEGYVPLATVKFVYQRQNADTEEVEFVMTDAELELLIDRAKQARSKIAVLNQKLNPILPDATLGGQE
ncbi:MAG: hypothetical protein CMJ47_06475 [Planctomyces sp.]|nr:hypothetical protein [Planctomyces sp.]